MIARRTIFLFFMSALMLTANKSLATTINATLIDPIFNEYYACAEHHDGQFSGLGDALGTDCYIVKSVEKNGRNWLRKHDGNGHKNTDWFSWDKPVLAPINGEVVKVNINKKVNKPGVKGSGVASYIIIKSADGINIMLAHIKNPKVKRGSLVQKGQQVASVGNNGQSFHPHIHIGAWKKTEALQIRFNQKKIKN